jgi:hypothetical protein
LLTFLKSAYGIIKRSVMSVKGIVKRLMVMTAEEKRIMQQRAVSVACVAAAAAYGAPQITAHVTFQKTEEAFLDHAAELATLINDAEGDRIDVPELDISKPWRQQVG